MRLSPRCPTCPISSRGCIDPNYSKGSPVHVSTLTGPTTRVGIRPVIPTAVGEGADHQHRAASCRLSATGISLLDILSRRGIQPSLRSAYQPAAPMASILPTGPRPGFPRSTHPSNDRIGCLLYPGTTRCSYSRHDATPAACPLFQGPGPTTPVRNPSPRVRSDETSSKVHSRSPARSSRGL